jgi:hypothetical protein
MRLKQCQLVDILQCAAALKQCRRGAAQHDDRRLGQLRIFDRRDRVGNARTRRDRRDARDTRQASHRVRRKDCGSLVAHVDDPDARILRAFQNR